MASRFIKDRKKEIETKSHAAASLVALATEKASAALNDKPEFPEDAIAAAAAEQTSVDMDAVCQVAVEALKPEADRLKGQTTQVGFLANSKVPSLGDLDAARTALAAAFHDARQSVLDGATLVAHARALQDGVNTSMSTSALISGLETASGEKAAAQRQELEQLLTVEVERVDDRSELHKTTTTAVEADTIATWAGATATMSLDDIKALASERLQAVMPSASSQAAVGQQSAQRSLDRLEAAARQLDRAGRRTILGDDGEDEEEEPDLEVGQQVKSLDCPLTRRRFQEPVVTNCNHTFEDSAIRQHLRRQRSSDRPETCPVCRKPLSADDLQPDEEMLLQLKADLEATQAAAADDDDDDDDDVL